MKINDVNQYITGFKTIRYITEVDDSKKNACFLQDWINKINTDDNDKYTRVDYPWF